MTTLTRRSLLRNSVGLAAVGVLPCPYTANAAATTVVTWWNQGYLPEEDVSFRALVANYQKASGDKIDYSLIPNAPLRQKDRTAAGSCWRVRLGGCRRQHSTTLIGIPG